MTTMAPLVAPRKHAGDRMVPSTSHPIARRTSRLLDSERFRAAPRTCGRFQGTLSLR
jgi:hypothetical protein